MTAETADLDCATLIPANPSELLGVLRRLRSTDAFWERIGGWVPESHLIRRQAYYRRRFARDKTPDHEQLHWLIMEFHADVTGTGAMDDSPLDSRVALDELLEQIRSLDSWPDILMGPFREFHELFTVLAVTNIMPAEIGLERLKSYARDRMAADYRLPVLPIS